MARRNVVVEAREVLIPADPARGEALHLRGQTPVPTQSGRNLHSRTAHVTVDGRRAKATWMISGSSTPLNLKRSSPPEEPVPLTGVHQLTRPATVVSASNTPSDHLFQVARACYFTQAGFGPVYLRQIGVLQ